MAPEGAVPRQRSGTIYLPRAGALNPPVRRQPITGRTLGAQGQRPGGAINPHARKGVSTYGNTGKHRTGPDPDRDTGSVSDKKTRRGAGSFCYLNQLPEGMAAVMIDSLRILC